MSNINSNRKVFEAIKPRHILLIQFLSWKGLATVSQVITKPGRGGDTSLLLRFFGQKKLKLLTWKNPNLIDIKILELEDVVEWLNGQT